MDLLLDTHVWLWWNVAAPELSRRCRRLLTDRDNVLYISPIVTWEMALLQRRGRIEIQGDALAWMQQAMRKNEAVTAEFTHEVAVEAVGLPEPIHRDPVDRLLIATARLNQMTLVTQDRRILAYRHVKSAG